MSDAVLRAVNLALQSMCAVEGLVMVMSFRRSILRSRSETLFFAKVVVATVCVTCSALFFLRGPELRDPVNVVLLSFAYVGLYAVYYLYIEYFAAQIRELDEGRPVSRAVLYVSLIICVVGSMLRIISSLDSNFAALNEATMNAAIPVEFGHLGGVVLIVITFAVLFRHRKTMGIRHTVVLGAMPVLMLVATFAEPHAHGIHLHYPLIMIEFIFVYTQHHLDIQSQMQRDENAGIKAKLALATGRMKPHYLYNVLTTIYYLCESDPQKAQRAIGTFSEYLRSTLETMERQELVNFSWELGEIRHYLELEKLRFGKRLRIDYDIETEDFKVPPLSIQPLVENAVKHGIAAKEEGGTVRIVSRKLSDGGSQIRIRDDGVGFDITTLKQLDSTHEGIANVRERLRLEVGGELTITSAPGKGTTAVVTIRPK